MEPGMKTNRIHMLLMIIAVVFMLLAFSCGDDDDDDNDSGGSSDDDDDTTADDDDDDNDDDDNDDDDDDDDDNDDDDNDDTTVADDYIASWPQVPYMPDTYDESGAGGPLRVKAEEYDVWHLTWHQRERGGCVHAYFSDDTYTELVGTHGHGDSCIWTGTYLGTQAMRYWITGDPQAKTNVIAKVDTLSGFLHVNGRSGFISRYWGSQDDSFYYQGDAWCDDPNRDRCHHEETGDFAGDFWIGGTSRDQYTGWFYGMTLAYDHVDDENMRTIIRADVAEVLDELISTNWVITDVSGEPTTAAPNVLPPMQLAWLLAGYHITGEDRFKVEVQKRIKNSYRTMIQLNSIAFFTRYAQYYGNNLAHTNSFTLLRLAEVYLSEDDYNFLKGLFENQVHTFTRLSHNPWFNAIFMGIGNYNPEVRDNPYQQQLEEDLTAFTSPPNWDYHLDERESSTYTLDPFSVFMHDLMVQYPFLEEIMGGIDYQAMEAFPIEFQCPAGFQFQRKPFDIAACGSGNVTQVHSGHDYLAAYWTASYFNNLLKEQ